MTAPLRLGVNIDHVATIRNARGGDHPDPVRAAEIIAHVGGDGITAHLREDRRHIRDADIERIMAATSLPLNLEMAATEEMAANLFKSLDTDGSGGLTETEYAAQMGGNTGAVSSI